VLLIGAMGRSSLQGHKSILQLGATSASALWFLDAGFVARWLAPVFARPGHGVLDLSVAVMMGL
jgi:L-lysine exporter family protein LysE/ArgO